MHFLHKQFQRSPKGSQTILNILFFLPPNYFHWPSLPSPATLYCYKIKPQPHQFLPQITLAHPFATMITPQHQIYIQNTPNDRPNHGNITGDRHNHGSLTDGRLNNGSLTDGHQVRQHHNAKYKRHHAQESLTTRVSKLICAVFLSILFMVGLVMFILWLSLRPHRPRFHIHEFSMPSLAETNGFSTAHVTFNLTSQNPNLEIGIYYDTMNLTLYYKDQTIAETPLLFPFYQSPKNTAIIYGTLSRPALKVSNVRWMQFLAARKLGVVSFRLDVTSSIRFKVSKWDSRHHKMHANCEIGVGPNGMLLANDREKKCPVYFS